MDSKLLLEFADWLEQNIKPNQFDFGEVINEYDSVHGCGTICCAIGWLPKFTPKVKWDLGCDEYPEIVMRMYGGHCLYQYDEIASALFNIPQHDAAHLFSPNNQSLLLGFDEDDNLDENVTPKQVADLIRKYVSVNTK